MFTNKFSNILGLLATLSVSSARQKQIRNKMDIVLCNKTRWNQILALEKIIQRTLYIQS